MRSLTESDITVIYTVYCSTFPVAAGEKYLLHTVKVLSFVVFLFTSSLQFSIDCALVITFTR